MTSSRDSSALDTVISPAASALSRQFRPASFVDHRDALEPDSPHRAWQDRLWYARLRATGERVLVH
jgi:hypothetical protein